MESLRYWMIFQTLLRIRLAISPFVSGYRGITSMSINNILVGAVVAIFGLAAAFVGLPGISHPEKKPV